MKYLKVNELPKSERPYEKCEKFGPGVLSDAELLAVIIRTGSRNERSTELACRILALHDGRFGPAVINHVSFSELTAVKGIGRVKAVQLLCAAELSRRVSMHTVDRNVYFRDADTIAYYFMESMRHLEREQVRVVFLDTRMKMIGERVLYEGTVGMAPLEAREILREVLKHDAVYFILLHNHPSGDPEPSSTDISSTIRIKEGGQNIGIRLLDHIVIGDNRYVSMKEAGYL